MGFEAKGNQLTSLPSAWQREPGSTPVTAPLSYVRLSSNPSLGGGFPLGLANYPNLTLLLLSENRLRWAACLLGEGCQGIEPPVTACVPSRSPTASK